MSQKKPFNKEEALKNLKQTLGELREDLSQEVDLELVKQEMIERKKAQIKDKMLKDIKDKDPKRLASIFKDLLNK